VNTLDELHDASENPIETWDDVLRAIRLIGQLMPPDLLARIVTGQPISGLLTIGCDDTPDDLAG
jgi:hypothetical protein